MPRLLTCGFELQDVVANSLSAGEDYLVTGAPTIDTGTFRSGLAALKCSSGAIRNAQWRGIAASTSSTTYSRMYLNVSALPAATARIMQFLTSAPNAMTSIRLTTTGTLQLWNDIAGTQIGTDSFALTTNQWYRVEFSTKLGAAGSCTAELLIDGVSIASLAAGTINNATLDRFEVGWVTSPGASGTIFIDDVAVNNSAGGGAQSAYPGSGKVVFLRPASDNARVGWTAGGGATTGLSAATNGTPPVGLANGSATNTSQIKDSTANTTDTYDANLGAYTDPLASGGGGLGASDTVSLVQPFVNFGPATAATCQVGVQTLSNPTIAEVVAPATSASAVGTYPTNWNTQYGTVTYAPAPTLGTGPVIRVRKATSAVTIDVDFLGLLVEYVPTAGVSLSGASVSTSTAAGALTAPTGLSGAAVSTAAAAGALTAATALSGAAAATSSASGALTAPTFLSGSAASVSAPSGALTATTFLSGSASSTSTAAGALSARALLSGAAASTSSAAGALGIIVSLSGSAAATSTVSGALRTAAALSGASVSTSLAAGAIAGGGTVSRVLLTRERPPLRLCVSVKTPDGPAYRWGADDPRAANKPQGLTFSTAMPGGFDQCSCTLERDPRLAYPDLVELSDVQVLGPGGDIAWDGRLEEFPDTAGDQAQVSPQCVGHQAHLDDDNSASEIYVDGQLTKWGDPSLSRQIAMLAFFQQLGQSSVAADPTSGTPALIQMITDSWVSPNLPLCEAWYDAGAGCLIAKIYYDVQAPSADPSWHEQVAVSSDANATTTLGSADLHGGAELAGYFTPATAYRFAFLQHYYGTTPAGAQGGAYPAPWKALVVYGDHGLTLYGPDPQGVLASDVIAHAVGKWAPKISFTVGPGGTIQPSAYVLTQLAFTPTTASAILKQAAQYELLDWAVWERTAGTDGPTLYVNERGARGKVWRARVGPAQLQESGPQVSRIWNGVIVSFTAVDGTTQTAGPPGSGATFTDPLLQDLDPQNPANEAGITRWAPLPLGTSTPTGAIQAGGVFLRAQREVATAGQAALVGHVQDSSGVWFPYWAVRGGDSVVFPDAHDTSPRRVVSTGCDDSTKTNTVQLDQPPDTTTALLERMSESIGPLGLS